DAAVFDAAKGQVGAAVRTVAIKQAELAFVVAEQDHVLIQQLDGLHGLGALELFGQGHGLPIAAQQFTGGGVRADPSDEIVLFSSKHGVPRDAWRLIQLEGAYRPCKARRAAPRMTAYSFTISACNVKSEAKKPAFSGLPGN